MQDQRTEFILNRISADAPPSSSKFRNHKIRSRVGMSTHIGAFPLDAICQESDQLIREITRMVDRVSLRTSPVLRTPGVALGPNHVNALAEEIHRLEVELVGK